jgi:hypothetical protein
MPEEEEWETALPVGFGVSRYVSRHVKPNWSWQQTNLYRLQRSAFRRGSFFTKAQPVTMFAQRFPSAVGECQTVDGRFRNTLV